KFNKQEHQRLREVFHESAELRIIGASSVSLEFHYDYGKPFYQFFRMPRLRGLNTEETKTLLLKLGEFYRAKRVKEIVANQSGRIEALRRMTGGVIRTIILLYEIFVDDANGNAFLDLEKILDSVTPLYKHRMDKLSPQQQEIVDFIALAWDAVSAGEIARKTKLESKAVSAQLQQLEKYHIIEKEKTTTKNYLYRIHERFFNIWYLMRLGRKWDERRVRFLVEFLQSWCDETDLEQRARKHLAVIKQRRLQDKHALLMTEALARTPLKRELQHELIIETRKYLDKQHSELKEYLSQSDYELSKIGDKAYFSDDFQTASQKLEQIKSKTADDLFVLGRIYHKYKKDFKQAEQYYLQAVAKEHAGAMYNLALLYQTEFKDFQKAEQYYLQAVAKDDADAMYNLALLYKTEFKDFQKAEQYYLKAVEKEHTGAMYNLALLYKTEFKDFQKAEQYYLKAVEKEHASAMYNLAMLYEEEFKDFQKAEKYYLKAIAKDHTEAMNSLAWLYFERKINKQKAIEYSERSFKKEKAIYNSHTYSMILLWDNQIEKAYEVAQEFLTNPESYEKFLEDVTLFLLLLIAKKQYQLALKLFNENPHHLKDRFKPIYYALMYFIQDEYPNEFRKMGGELKQTVDEIIEKIDQLAKDYQ
ncbi:MAG: tetratricopeptide repeat protein, partial [bacterium]|nr:tetratricopeptide repeat protein [bacterium]